MFARLTLVFLLLPAAVLAGANDPYFVRLGSLPGSLDSSFATGISGDAVYVVGGANSSNGNEAFRWTEAEGMVGVGDFEGGSYASVARACSADGSVIVGDGVVNNFDIAPFVDLLTGK